MNDANTTNHDIMSGNTKGEVSMENVIAERVKNARLTHVQMKIAEYIIANPELHTALKNELKPFGLVL